MSDEATGAAAPAAVFDSVPPEAAGWPASPRYEAGGGVVIHAGRALVLERRNGEVRLPKGHREPGETLAACALREVREEAGLAAPAVVARLGTLENRFAFRGERHARRETWFLLAVADPTIGAYRCDRTGDEREDAARQWVPAWRPLAAAARALTYEAERLALRWAVAALGTRDDAGTGGR